MADKETPSESNRWRNRLVGRKVATLFGNSDFRRLYLGRMVSRVGDKLYFIAAMWLVYELIGSTFYTGIAGFPARVPQALGFVFGPLVDRSRLGRLLVFVEAAQGIVVLAVPVAAYFGRLNAFVVLAVVPVLALLRRATAPAEQAALSRLVDDDLLARANSLDSATKQALGATAEAVSGVLIALVGAVALFVVNGVTFAASALFFGLLRIPPTEKTGASSTAGEYLDDIREGFGVVRRSTVGHMVVAASLAGIFTGMATAVLPAFADEFSGAGAYGLIVAATTVGTLLGSLAASRFESVRLSRVTISGFLVATAGRAGSVVLDWPPAVLALYGASAVPVGVYNVLVSTTLQTGVPNGLLARVSSTIGSLTAVLGPLGLLLGGYLDGVVGSETVIGVSAFGYCLVAVYWYLIPALREFPSVGNVEANSFGARTET
ncbi:MFS transporter [Haladaptatus halobius]|uniref:MFS transporter n=1 Tax=Haladaptatus halobius TaxID=2884875 RepID=UPI001D09E5E9|nr:MFS transporter [Haladaptatus halobius]